MKSFIATALLSLVAAAASAQYPAGWSLHTFPSAPQEARCGARFVSTPSAMLVDNPSLFLGVFNPTAGTCDFREVRFAQGGDLPTQAQEPNPIRDGAFRKAEMRSTFAILLSACEDACSTIDMRVWNFRRNPVGDLVASDQVITSLRISGAADNADFAVIPAAGSNWVGVVTYLAANPTDPRACPLIAQRFQVGDTGIVRVGSPVTLTTVDTTQSAGFSISTKLVRQPDNSVSVFSSCSHLRTSGEVCGTTNHFRCIQTDIATARIAGGQLTPVSRTTVNDAINAAVPTPRAPIATAIACDSTGFSIYHRTLGTLADGTASCDAWRRRITIVNNNITAVATSNVAQMTGVRNNPLYQGGTKEGVNPLYTGRTPSGQPSHIFAVPGLLTSDDRELLGLFHFPDDINSPALADSQTFALTQCCTDCIATAACASLGDNGAAGDRLLAIGAPMYSLAGVPNAGAVLLPDDIFGAPACPADFNQDGGVDGTDVEAFFIAWSAGEPTGDFDRSGGIDGQDVEAFFARWTTGC